MKKNLLLLFFWAVGCLTTTLQAQNWNLANGTQNMCSGTFQDPGGAGNYGNSQNITGTICSSTPGQCIAVNFTSFNLDDAGSGADYLYVYDGNSTSAPASSILTNAAVPGSIVSSTGCLTFRFVSDGANVSSGWSANISCTNCAPDASTPACPSVNAGPDVNSCSGQCVTLSATAASSGGTQSYTVVNIPYAPMSYTTGSNQLVDTDDIWSGVLSIGFNFCYYGQTYNQIVVGANGCISFNTAYANQYNIWATTTPLPDPADHVNQICAPYHDIDPSVGFNPDRIKYEVTGSAPCRRLKIAWNNIPMFSCNSMLAAQQIILYETTNVIETHIANKPTCASWNSGEAMHGIENQNGSIATVVPGRNYPTQWSVTNDGKRFVPAGTATYTLSWYQGATLLGTGPTLQVCPTVTTTYQVRAVYTKCDGTTVTVTDDVTVNITSNITANITQTQPFSCTSVTVPLSVTVSPPGAYTYVWAPGANIASGQGTPTVNINSSGTYTVTVTNAANCQATASITVAPSNPPTANATPSPNTACAAPFNGSVVVTTTNFAASPTPTYAWSNGATTQNLNNVAAGTYTVTVTQGSCNVTATATVANNSAVTANATPSPNTACAAPYNGSVSTSTTGFAASPPLTYAWSNGATTQNLSNVANGTYSVTISQGAGCTATAAAVVANNAAVSASATPTPNTACSAPFNGSINVSTSGFAGTPTYTWSNGATTQNLSNVAGGTYTVTVTQGACSATATATINNNTPVSASASATPNTSCSLPFNGSVNASGTGFSGTPTYIWSNGATTQNLSNVAAGTYTVTISQGAGCTATASATVANNTPVSASATATPNTACTAPFTGEVTSSSTGFTGTPTYTWSNGATTQNLSNVIAGTYTVTISQGNCSATASATVADNPVVPTAAISGLSSACVGDANPTWTASGGGTYLWSTGATTASITPTVTAGASSTTYSVTVTATNGCTASATQTFTVNICACPNPVTILINNTDVAICATENIINLTTTATGGPTLTWTTTGSGTFSSTSAPNPTYTFSAADIAAGSLTITVTTNDPDGAGTLCQPATDNITFTLTSPTASATPTPNTACSAPFNGNVSLTTTGFISPSYTWSNGETTQNLSNVPAGTYTVTVTDANCTATATATVTNNINLTATATATPNTACSPPFDGDVSLTTSGFTGTPTYTWSNGATTQNLSNVPAGTYTVTVTSGSCTATATATVTNNITLTASATPINNSTCNLPFNGGVNLTTSGFTNPTYTWSNGATTQNLSNLQGLAGGETYTVTVTDGSCSTTATATVINTVIVSAAATSTPNTACGTPYNGNISLTTSGFTNPTYTWSNGATTQNLSGLNASDAGINYTVTVTEGACTATATVDIFNNITLSASATPTPNTNCGMPYSGSVSLNVSGFTNPTYIWSNGETTQNLNNITNGTYTVTVTEGTCVATATATVPDNTDPQATLIPIPNTQCLPPFSGSLTLNVSGFNAPTYTWSNGATTQNQSNLAPGSYSVTVSEGNCTVIATATIDDNISPPTAFLQPTPNIACVASLFNGAVDLSTDGNQFLWNTGATTEDLTNMAAGTYTVTITNTASGCTTTATTTVANEAATPDLFVVNPITITCNSFNGQEILLASTGIGGVQFVWSASNGGNIVAGGDTETPLVDAAGTYNVTITAPGGCTNTGVCTVIVAPPPATTITGNNAACQGGSVTLSASAGYEQYNWSSGDTSQVITITPSATSTYSVTVTDGYGCTATASTTVTINPPPTPSISGALTFCQNGNTTLDAGAGYSSYLWTGGTTTQTLLVTTGGNYCVTVTDANSCTGTACVTVTVNSTLTPIIQGGDFCEGGSVALDAGGGLSSYLWSEGSTTQTITVNTIGTYTVTVSDATGCTGTGTINVAQNPNPTPAISGDNSICAGTTTTIDAGTYSGYIWSNGSTTQTINVGVGTWNVTVTDANGCTGTATFTITETPNPTPAIAGNIPFCINSSIVLDAGAGYSSYAWSPSGNTQTITADQAGAYAVTVTDANGCTGSDSVNTTTNPLPTPAITGDLGICPTESTTLTATAGYEAYLWSNGNTADNITTTIAAPYSVTVTDNNGCEGTASVTVIQNNAAVPNITGDNDICLGQSTTLNAGVYAQYTWLPDAQTTASITVSPTNSTTYSVTVTDGDGCTASNSTNVTVNELPVVEIGGSTTFCAGSNLFLSATFGFDTYQWDPNVGNVSDIVVSSSGTYSVTVTDDNGCTDSNSITVTQSTSLNPVITGDLNLCSGETTTLSVGTFDSYQWSANAGSATTPTITVSNAGSYCVTVSDASGCTGTRCATVVVNPNPAPDITGGAAICPGSSTVLSAGTYSSYTWQDGSFNATYTATAAGTYTVTVTDANGCTGTDNFVVTLNANLSPAITGDPDFCAGGNSILDAGTGYASYLWSTAATTQTITVTTGGTYSVTVADSGGCSGTDDFAVTVNANPTPSITGDLAICNGQNTTLTVSGGTSYTWSDGLGTTAAVTVSPTANTTYSVTASDANACSGTASATVVVNSATAPTLTGDTDICNGTCTTLNVVGVYSSYLWSGGQTTASVNVCPTANSTFSVTVTDANGCTQTGSINVTVNNNPQPTGGNASFCDGGNTTLSVGTWAAYSWSTGSTNATIIADATGSYCVTITDSNGCTGSTCFNVTESSGLSPIIIGDSEICAGETSTLDAGIFSTYEWSANAGGATTQTVDVTTSGTYCVTVTNVGCSGTACFDVNANANPTPDISGVTALCAGNPTTLDAGAGYASYEWSANAGGVFSQTVSINASGTYTVTVTDANGCTGTDDETVSITPNPTPDITGDLTICSGETTTLDAGSFAAYTWTGGATTQTLSVNVGGTYSVTVTDANGCTGTDNATVIENTPITPNITGDTDICAGQSTTLDAGSYTNYIWSPGGENTATITVSPAANTTYAVTVTDSNGCTSSNEQNVLVNALPVPQIGGSLSYCVGSSTVLSANPGYLYDWSNGSTTEFVTITAPGNYCVTITDQITTCSAAACVDVTESTSLSPQITGDLAICQGESTTLDAGIFTGTYQWSNSATTQTISVNTAGTYCVTVSDAGGCTGSTCVDVVANANPIPTITGPASICVGSNATLDAGAYAAYEWSANAGASLNQTVTVSPAAATTYAVTVTDSNGCMGTADFDLSISTNLSPTITGGTDICVGSSTTLDAGVYDSYAWSPAGTGNTQTVNVSPTANTTYTVTVTDASGCTGTAAITVNINANLSPTITGDTDICAGQSTTLDAGVYDSYAWSPAGTGNTQTVTVTPAANTTYAVTVTDASGCTGTANLTVNVNANPTPTIIGDLTICEEESTTLDAGAGYATYTWLPAGTGSSQTVAVTPAATTTYGVTVTDDNGCTGNTTATVTVENCDCIAPAVPTLSVSGAEICAGETNTVAFTATPLPNTTIVWYDGPNSDTANQLGTGATYTLNSTATTTIYAFALNSPDDGCISEGIPATLTVYPLPVAALTTTPDGLCVGETSVVAFSGTASTEATYMWNFGVGAIPPLATGVGPHNVMWTTTGEKTVTLMVTDTGGCTDNTTTTVAVSSMTVEVTPNTATIPQGSSILLTAEGISALNGTISYTWTPDGSLSCNDCAVITAIPVEATTYTVVAIDEYGCEAEATAIINTTYQRAVIIPNAFSPNGDGENELFRPTGLNVQDIYLEIRNRWGNKIYAETLTNLDLQGWDGKFDGKDCDMAVYVYYATVTFTDGSQEFLKGNVTLVR